MSPTVLTQFVARLLLAPTMLIALAILVKGYTDVGDGFAAGVVAALGVLLQALAFDRDPVGRVLPLQHAGKVAVAGLAIAVLVALAPVLTGSGTLLQHSPGPGEAVAKIGTIELITAFAFDIGVFLLVTGTLVAVLEALARERVEEGPAS